MEAVAPAQKAKKNKNRGPGRGGPVYRIPKSLRAKYPTFTALGTDRYVYPSLEGSNIGRPAKNEMMAGIHKYWAGNKQATRDLKRYMHDIKDMNTDYALLRADGRGDDKKQRLAIVKGYTDEANKWASTFDTNQEKYNSAYRRRIHGERIKAGIKAKPKSALLQHNHDIMKEFMAARKQAGATGRPKPGEYKAYYDSQRSRIPAMETALQIRKRAMDARQAKREKEGVGKGGVDRMARILVNNVLKRAGGQ